MRRFLTALIVLALTANVFAAEKYVDNTLLASGTAGAGGTTTTIELASATLLGVTHADLQWAGMVITAGTSAPAKTVHYKIQSVAGTVATVSPAFPASSAADWTYQISVGCNLNSAASATRGSSTTGPNIGIRWCATANAASGDRINIKMASRDYTEENDSTAYLLLPTNKALTFEGYNTTIGDLATTYGSLASAYESSSANPASRLTSAAASDAQNDYLHSVGAAELIFPKIAITYNNATLSNIVAQDGASGPFVFRCLYIKSGSGNTCTHLFRSLTDTTLTNGLNLSLDTCLLDATTVTSQDMILDSESQGAAGYFDLKNCYALVNGSAIDAKTIGRIRMRGCRIDSTPSANGDHILSINAPAHLAANCVGAIDIDSCELNHSASTNAARTSYGIYITNADQMEYCRVTRSKISLLSQGGGFIVDSCREVDLSGTVITANNATSVGILASFGSDTSVTGYPAFTGGRYLVASGQVGATGNDATHIHLSGTAGAADDAYNTYSVAKTRQSTGVVEWRILSDYADTGDLGTVNASWTDNPTSSDTWAIYKDVYQRLRIDNCKFEATSTSNGAYAVHGVLIGQGFDAAEILNSQCLRGTIGWVIKSEHVKMTNCAANGKKPLLLKGSSWGTYDHCTMVVTDTASSGALELQDTSSVAAGLQAANYGKCQGNTFQNCVFTSLSGFDTWAVVYERTGAGAWSTDANREASMQDTRFTNNIYYRPDGGNLFFVNNKNVANLAAMQALWRTTGTVTSATGTTAVLGSGPTTDDAFDYGWLRITGGTGAGQERQMSDYDVTTGVRTATVATWTVTPDATSTFEMGLSRMTMLNDANSSGGSITFAGAAAGNFAVTGGSAASAIGTDGRPIGAARSKVLELSPWILP